VNQMGSPKIRSAPRAQSRGSTDLWGERDASGDLRKPARGVAKIAAPRHARVGSSVGKSVG